MCLTALTAYSVSGSVSSTGAEDCENGAERKELSTLKTAKKNRTHRGFQAGGEPWRASQMMRTRGWRRAAPGRNHQPRAAPAQLLRPGRPASCPAPSSPRGAAARPLSVRKQHQTAPQRAPESGFSRDIDGLWRNLWDGQKLCTHIAQQAPF